VKTITRPRWIIAFLIVPVVLGAWGDASAREIVGRGDFTFYLDSATFRGTGGKAFQEIYIRIPNNEIKFSESGDEFKSKLKISIQLLDAEGEPVIQESERLELVETHKSVTESSVFFQTIIKRFLLEPGTYTLSYAVQDLESPKKTVLGVIRGKFSTSGARRIRLAVPEIPEDAPSFSSPMFVWQIDRDGDKNVYHPNPPRMYGLYKDTLTAYVELYLPDSMADAPTFEFRSYVLDTDGNTMASRVVSLPNPLSAGDAGGTDSLKAYPVVIHEDLATFPAGAYSLNFSFGIDSRVLSRIRAGLFSVAWDIRTWEVPRRDLLAEAKFLLTEKEYEIFLSLSLGEQESRLDDLWKEEDPAPETGINESYEEFLIRLAYVNDQFYDGRRPAIFSDRGQVYMRWGPPDEFAEDAIPVNRETISEAFAAVEDKYHPVNYSTHGVKPYSTVTRSNDIDPRRLGHIGEGGNTAYPFELWVYNGAGKPILSRDRLIDPDIGMRYLFIDREGYGVYRLESSTKISDK
jgi:GWxTD domain-containing protein